VCQQSILAAASRTYRSLVSIDVRPMYRIKVLGLGRRMPVRDQGLGLSRAEAMS